MNLKKKRDKCFFAVCLTASLIVSGYSAKSYAEETTAEQEQIYDQELKYETSAEQISEQETEREFEDETAAEQISEQETERELEDETAAEQISEQKLKHETSAEKISEQENEQKLEDETAAEQSDEQEAARKKSGKGRALLYAVCIIAFAAGAFGIACTFLKNDSRTASAVKRETVPRNDPPTERAAVPVQPVQPITQYDPNVDFDVFEYTSRGGRDYNEDCVGSWYNEYGGIFVAADGLGGHQYGEMASLKAVETVINGWDTSDENISARLERKITEANSNIIELQKENNVTMKTTVAALAVRGRKAAWANSGDSRVYFIHGNELHSCTNDHSVAFKKYKAGEITREQIAADEDQSSLLRSLGGKDRYEPELYEADVRVCSGDAFLLCSDGAWEYLLDEEILIDFLKSETAQQWSELLMLRIMERVTVGNDNLSLLTVIIK